MSCGHSLQRGFTLIEVLVALTLLALLSLISWRGLDAMQQGGERLDARARDTLAIVHALSQLERDLLLHAGADVIPAAGAAGQGMPAGPLAGPMALLTPAAPAAGTGAPPSLALPGVVWSPGTGLWVLRAAGEGRWQPLHWYLQDGVLYRAAGPAGFSLTPGEGQQAVAVLAQVGAWSLRFWRPRVGWVAAGQVQDAPAGADAYTGIEITLHRQGAGGSVAYRKVVVLG